jgi:hypothetical protein
VSTVGCEYSTVWVMYRSTVYSIAVLVPPEDSEYEDNEHTGSEGCNLQSVVADQLR